MPEPHRHPRVLGALMLAISLVPGSAIQPMDIAAAQACVDGWRPTLLSGDLAHMEPQGAASLGGEPAWAVGIASARLHSRAPLIAGWIGGRWQSTPGPWTKYGVLNAVAATAPNNAWTVGSIGSYTRWPVSARWNGAGWSNVPVPKPAGQLGTFTDLAMLSSDQFWAVGARLDAGRVKPLAVLRGTETWTTSSPVLPGGAEGGLTDVTVGPNGRVWASGWRTDASGEGRPWVVYRSGTKWINSPMAPVATGRSSVMDLTFASPHDGWAAGFVESSGDGYIPLLQHWNGTSWTAVALPWASSRSILLHAVEVDGAGRLTLAGMEVDDVRRDVLAVREPAGWRVTSLSQGTDHNSVLMDTAPLSTGTLGAGFFDLQALLMLPCTGQLASPATPLTVPDRRGGQHPVPGSDARPVDHDEADMLQDRASVQTDPLAGSAVAVSGTSAADMTVAAGLAMRAPTWQGLVADFNSDGLDDVFIGLHFQARPRLMVNSASGVFTEQDGEFVWQDRHGCDTDDVDLDGRLDLFCTIGVNKGTSNTPQELVLGAAYEDGEWSARDYGVLDGFGRGRNATFLNLGGDPYPDLYVMNEPSRSDAMSSSNRLYQNTDGAKFVMAPEWGIDHSMGGNCGTNADLDGDGDDDLLVCASESFGGLAYGARVFINDGVRFVDQTSALGIVPSGDDDIAAADFNEDGRLDLALLSWTRLRIYLATGDGFVRAFETPTPGAIAMAIGDVDADDAPDVYITRRTGGNAGHLMLVNRPKGRPSSQW